MAQQQSILFIIVITLLFQCYCLNGLMNNWILGNTEKIYRSRRNIRVFAAQISDLSKSYSGSQIEAYYDKRPFEVWQRLVDIGSPILGWWILRKYENMTSQYRTPEQQQELVNIRAADLKDSIVQGKSVTFIKSGQALALRADLVKSPEYIRELTKLQDEVGTFDNVDAFAIIEQELGRPAREIFDFGSSEVPIASASIGQVYKVKIRATDQVCALKVQRPDALDSAALDMYILRKLAAYTKKRYKLRSDLVGVADEFGCQLFNELNYRQEANNCLKFKILYGSIDNIYVPDVYLNYTSTRVLAMEFVEGTKGPWAIGGEKMLTLGLQCSVLQLLDTGYFHADPHRGNLLQTPDGKLCYLDFGMMAEVSAERRFALIGAALGLVNKEVGLVIRNLKILEFFPPDTDTDVIITALNKAIDNSTENGQGSTLNFTRLNQNLQGIQTILPFRLPPFYTLIVRTLTILEGLALYVDKDFKLIKGAYPFIAKQLLTSNSTELQQLLSTVILDEKNKIRWNRLEQFVSISSNADRAMGGDFSALKSAQERSDVVKAFRGEQEQSNFTYDISTQILDYLISDKGTFLREPLIEEIVETVDALGLTSISLLSLGTYGLIPMPVESPDRQRVEQFINLLNIFLRNKTSAPLSSNVVETLSSSLDQLKSLITSVSIENLQKSQPLLGRLSFLATQVFATVSEKNARRLVKAIFQPERIETTLPLAGRMIELGLGLVPRKKQ